MLNAKEARAQIARLAGLPGYEKAKESGRRELGRLIQDRCSSADHARRVIDAALGKFMFLPAPAELSAIIEQVPADEALADRRKQCPICGGTGYVSRDYLVTTHRVGEKVWRTIELIEDSGDVPAWKVASDLRRKIGPDQQVVAAAKRCECMGGA